MTILEIVDRALAEYKATGAVAPEVTIVYDQCLYSENDSFMDIIVVLSDGTFLVVQCIKETLH